MKKSKIQSTSQKTKLILQPASSHLEDAIKCAASSFASDSRGMKARGTQLSNIHTRVKDEQDRIGSCWSACPARCSLFASRRARRRGSLLSRSSGSRHAASATYRINRAMNHCMRQRACVGKLILCTRYSPSSDVAPCLMGF